MATPSPQTGLSDSEHAQLHLLVRIWNLYDRLGQSRSVGAKQIEERIESFLSV